jgi:diphthamide biosynthesis protein 4
MANKLNYYKLLQLERRSETALPAQKVKEAYRRALLLHHPDKNRKAPHDEQVTVDDIALAYKTLSDAKLRLDYDRWLDAFVGSGGDLSGHPRPSHTGLETVDLDDLAFDSASSVWSRGCRCGETNGFTVSELELEKQLDEGEIIVGCKGCSLWLRILFGLEE